MARDDQQKQMRRARDDLDKGLKRGDASLAGTGLLGLPAELRTDALPAVGRLLRKELQAQFSRRDWAGLRALGPRFDKEPRLLAAGDDSHAGGPTAQVHWALMWAALEHGHLPDAQRRLELLTAVEPLPPRLSEAIAALCAGTFTPELVPPGCEDDERLGNELPMVARPPPPATAADVEPALLQLTALRPFSALATAVRDWLPGASTDVACGVRHLGCDLCLRELLQQVRGGGSLAEPTVLLAELLAGAGNDDVVVERVALVALRLVTQALPVAEIKGRQTVTSRSSTQAFLTLAGAVASRPRLRDMAMRLVEGLHFHEDLSPVVGPALERLLQANPRPGVWVEAVDLWMLRTPSGTPAPAPLVAALAALVDDGSVAALFSGPDEALMATRRLLLEMTVLTMPVVLAERTLEQAFAAADERSRVAIGVNVEELVARVRTEAVSPPGGWKSLVQREAFAELAAIAAHSDGGEVEAILDDARARGLSRAQAMELHALVTQLMRGNARVPQATALWDRWSKRLLPLHGRFFELALDEAFAAQTMTFQGALDLAVEHLAGRPDIASWVRVLELLDEIDVDLLPVPRAGALANAFAELLVDRFRDDVSALARALELARHAPRPIAVLIARGLLEAAERGPVPDSDTVTREIANARRLVPRLKTATGKMAKKAPKKATTKKAATEETTKKPTTKKAATDKTTKKPTTKKAAKAPSDDLPF